MKLAGGPIRSARPIQIKIRGVVQVTIIQSQTDCSVKNTNDVFDDALKYSKEAKWMKMVSD